MRSKNSVLLDYYFNSGMLKAAAEKGAVSGIARILKEKNATTEKKSFDAMSMLPLLLMGGLGSGDRAPVGPGGKQPGFWKGSVMPMMKTMGSFALPGAATSLGQMGGNVLNFLKNKPKKSLFSKEPGGTPYMSSSLSALSQRWDH